ncbi:DgyrCDS12789 [Dimorphilus gyrociliatus]|uniref:N-acetylgalactosaminide beta-1,3-galactosyltransferase n=1 Tax=Dimorphilus gyrociliatus TaxID=2664684 RepID=A0A7I8W8R0_9ANNE|nr:DgyrCDS12789 [Dimorphilus gyrociliatus]
MFFGERDDPIWPMVKLPIRESFQKLPAKTMAAFKYVHKHFYDSYDYFLKADDDTYIIIENLRYLLMSYNDYKDQPIYIGHKMKRHVQQGYLSGGASYVLNKVALNKLIKDGLANSGNVLECTKEVGAEDATLGRCLEKLGIKIANSLDCDEKDSFHPFNLQTYITGNYPTWYKTFAPKDLNVNNCCSPYTVSFHFVDPSQMEIYHYLIYHMEVYGKPSGIPQRPMFKASFT